MSEPTPQELLDLAFDARYEEHNIPLSNELLEQAADMYAAEGDAANAAACLALVVENPSE